MHDKNVRRAQIVFLVVLAVSAAQVLWWVLDQSLYAQAVHDRWKGLYEADVVAASELLNRGVRTESIETLFPHLDVSLDEVTVSARALEQLNAERHSHVNQYAWEGFFFLAVIFSGMAVILRSVRRDAQLRRWQTNFLAAVTHELKSPLASLQLAAQTLEMRDSNPEYRKRLLTRMLSDVDRLSTTVAKVIDTERLDQRHVHREPRRLLLSDLVNDAVTALDLRAKDASVEMWVNVPKGLEIEADPVGARTVLRNLLDNALKAMVENKSGEVRVTAAQTDEGVRLEVADEGVGFPMEEAPNLFQKFYRVGDELRRTATGSGLGLYLTRRFVELDGGRISATSEGPGLGATFTVIWPTVTL
ncbi:MAG: HAMP domain-containing sensor histidine kinase [Acidobacteriota bacterium]